MSNKLIVGLMLIQISHISLIQSEEPDAIETPIMSDEKLIPPKQGELYSIIFEAEEPEIKHSKNETTVVRQTGIGKIEMSCEVENTDFASQCLAKWDKDKKKQNPTEKSNEKSHDPKASVSISWSWD
jgi:hypothetical protein